MVTIVYMMVLFSQLVYLPVHLEGMTRNYFAGKSVTGNCHSILSSDDKPSKAQDSSGFISFSPFLLHPWINSTQIITPGVLHGTTHSFPIEIRRMQWSIYVWPPCWFLKWLEKICFILTMQWNRFQCRIHLEVMHTVCVLSWSVVTFTNMV